MLSPLAQWWLRIKLKLAAVLGLQDYPGQDEEDE